MADVRHFQTLVVSFFTIPKDFSCLNDINVDINTDLATLAVFAGRRWKSRRRAEVRRLPSSRPGRSSSSARTGFNLGERQCISLSRGRIRFHLRIFQDIFLSIHYVQDVKFLKFQVYEKGGHKLSEISRHQERYHCVEFISSISVLQGCGSGLRLTGSDHKIKTVSGSYPQDKSGYRSSKKTGSELIQHLDLIRKNRSGQIRIHN